MKNSVHWMYSDNLVINDGIIYDNTYGWRKIYIFANELWNLSVLKFTYRVVIDKCINDPLHGRSKIYGINSFY